MIVDTTNVRSSWDLRHLIQLKNEEWTRDALSVLLITIQDTLVNNCEKWKTLWYSIVVACMNEDSNNDPFSVHESDALYYYYLNFLRLLLSIIVYSCTVLRLHVWDLRFPSQSKQKWWRRTPTVCVCDLWCEPFSSRETRSLSPQ